MHSSFDFALLLSVTVPEIGVESYDIALELFNFYAPVLAVLSGYSVAISLLVLVARWIAKIIKQI